MKYLILIATLILTISCSKNKDNPEPSYNEVFLNVYLWKKEIPVKITTITDEGSFDFEITKDLNDKAFKVKNGYTFVASCADETNTITIELRDKYRNVLKTQNGSTLVKISSH